MTRNRTDVDTLAKAYFVAKKYVIENGYSNEIDWQSDVDFNDVTHQIFLQEYAWVVLASGLSDKVVSIIYPKIQDVFKDWTDIKYLSENEDSILSDALKIFNNELKIKALVSTIHYIKSNGFSYVKRSISSRGIEYLKDFPFIGDATCFHLAKNLGLSYAKPDRHLQRISIGVGFESPHELCRTISEHIDEKIEVVDLVLWRYATLDRNYKRKISNLFHNHFNNN